MSLPQKCVLLASDELTQTDLEAKNPHFVSVHQLLAHVQHAPFVSRCQASALGGVVLSVLSRQTEQRS